MRRPVSTFAAVTATVFATVVVVVCGCGSVTTTADAGAAGSHGADGAAGAASAGTTGSHDAGTDAAGGGGGSAGASGAAGSSGDAGTNRPCLDMTCNGTCKGQSCDTAWTCDMTAQACTADIADYCGCDGQTFQASSSCPTRAFASRGACAATTISCDPSKILCKRVAPTCATGEVPSVEGSCYGACVKIDQCACAAPADCPSPDQYTCHMNVKRCGPFVQ
jgi:hypothetical protein